MSWFLGKKKTVGELLFAAAHDGNQEEIEKLWATAKSSDLEYVNEKGYGLHHGFTPLMVAASMGHAKTVKFFMTLEGNINHQDAHRGWTPLIEAAGNNHLAVVQLLINEPGLKVNAHDSAGMTALHWAAKHSRLEILKLLLAHPLIEVNLRDSNGKIAEDVAGTGEAYKLFCVYRGVDPAVIDGTLATPPSPSPSASPSASAPPSDQNTTSSAEHHVSAAEHAALIERVNKLEKTVLVLSTHLAKSNAALHEHIAASELRFAQLTALVSDSKGDASHDAVLSVKSVHISGHSPSV